MAAAIIDFSHLIPDQRIKLAEPWQQTLQELKTRGG